MNSLFSKIKNSLISYHSKEEMDNIKLDSDDNIISNDDEDIKTYDTDSRMNQEVLETPPSSPILKQRPSNNYSNNDDNDIGDCIQLDDGFDFQVLNGNNNTIAENDNNDDDPFQLSSINNNVSFSTINDEPDIKASPSKSSTFGYATAVHTTKKRKLEELSNTASETIPSSFEETEIESTPTTTTTEQNQKDELLVDSEQADNVHSLDDIEEVDLDSLQPVVVEPPIQNSEQQKQQEQQQKEKQRQEQLKQEKLKQEKLKQEQLKQEQLKQKQRQQKLEQEQKQKQLEQQKQQQEQLKQKQKQKQEQEEKQKQQLQKEQEQREREQREKQEQEEEEEEQNQKDSNIEFEQHDSIMMESSDGETKDTVNYEDSDYQNIQNITTSTTTNKKYNKEIIEPPLLESPPLTPASSVDDSSDSSDSDSQLSPRPPLPQYHPPPKATTSSQQSSSPALPQDPMMLEGYISKLFKNLFPKVLETLNLKENGQSLMIEFRRYLVIKILNKDEKSILFQPPPLIQIFYKLLTIESIQESERSDDVPVEPLLLLDKYCKDANMNDDIAAQRKRYANTLSTYDNYYNRYIAKNGFDIWPTNYLGTELKKPSIVVTNSSNIINKNINNNNNNNNNNNINSARKRTTTTTATPPPSSNHSVSASKKRQNSHDESHSDSSSSSSSSDHESQNSSHEDSHDESQYSSTATTTRQIQSYKRRSVPVYPIIQQQHQQPHQPQQSQQSPQHNKPRIVIKQAQTKPNTQSQSSQSSQSSQTPVRSSSIRSTPSTPVRSTPSSPEKPTSTTKKSRAGSYAIKYPIGSIVDAKSYCKGEDYDDSFFEARVFSFNSTTGKYTLAYTVDGSKIVLDEIDLKLPSTVEVTRENFRQGEKVVFKKNNSFWFGPGEIVKLSEKYSNSFIVSYKSHKYSLQFDFETPVCYYY